MLDLAFLFILSYLVGALLGMLGLGGVIQAMGLMYGFAVFFIYYAAQESLSGRTLGKLIVGTRVVDHRGAQPSAARVAARTLCRWIPGDPLSFFFMGELSRPTGWHDTISKTKVVAA